MRIARNQLTAKLFKILVIVRTKLLILAVTVAVVVSGCGVYSFSGSMGSGIKSIAVPVFENKSLEYGISDELTSGVIDRFVTDNTLKVLPRSKADAVLEGLVNRYERVAYTFDENDQVQEYKVNISVSVKLIRSDGSSMWEEQAMIAYGIYKADEEAEEDGKTRAIEKIAEDIVNKTIRDW